MKAKERIIIFQDIFTIVEAIILLVLFFFSSVWIWQITKRANIIGSLASIWGSRILAIVIGLCIPVLFVVNPDRYIAWYLFTSEGITYYTLFRKKQFIPYSSFPYIMLGKYLHGVHWQKYIVFSNRRLTDSELSHINHVTPSRKLIKIRYSEKTKTKLLAILPPKQKRVISALYSSNQVVQ